MQNKNNFARGVGNNLTELCSQNKLTDMRLLLKSSMHFRLLLFLVVCKYYVLVTTWTLHSTAVSLENRKCHIILELELQDIVSLPTWMVGTVSSALQDHKVRLAPSESF